MTWRRNRSSERHAHASNGDGSLPSRVRLPRGLALVLVVLAPFVAQTGTGPRVPRPVWTRPVPALAAVPRGACSVPHPGRAPSPPADGTGKGKGAGAFRGLHRAPFFFHGPHERSRTPLSPAFASSGPTFIGVAAMVRYTRGRSTSSPRITARKPPFDPPSRRASTPTFSQKRPTRDRLCAVPSSNAPPASDRMLARGCPPSAGRFARRVSNRNPDFLGGFASARDGACSWPQCVRVRAAPACVFSSCAARPRSPALRRAYRRPSNLSPLGLTFIWTRITPLRSTFI